MPRVRCHWALLGQTFDAFGEALPQAHAVVSAHPGEYFAGGIAPDAIRLFAGVDKARSHFYDDQRPDTWKDVVRAICSAQPSVANASLLTPEAQAWMLGYLVHVLTDIAYWRHVLSQLPPFPAHAEAHYGAWLLADNLPLPHNDDLLSIEAIRFEAAPAWVDAASVRRLLRGLTERLLPPRSMWTLELAYLRGRQALDGRADDDLLREHLPQWQRCLAQAESVLHVKVWERFQEDAVQGAVQAVARYLEQSE